METKTYRVYYKKMDARTGHYLRGRYFSFAEATTAAEAERIIVSLHPEQFRMICKGQTVELAKPR